MGLVSFIAKGRKVVFQAKTSGVLGSRTQRKARIIKGQLETAQTKQRSSRIKQVEKAIKIAKKTGTPFTKEQKFRLRLQARGLASGSSSNLRSRTSRTRNISNNPSDMNV